MENVNILLYVQYCVCQSASNGTVLYLCKTYKTVDHFELAHTYTRVECLPALEQMS